jgi:hypothetical protein
MGEIWPLERWFDRVEVYCVPGCYKRGAGQWHFKLAYDTFLMFVTSRPVSAVFRGRSMS